MADPDPPPLGALARQGVDREREPSEGDTATAAWRRAVQEARDAGTGRGTGEAPETDWTQADVVDEAEEADDGTAPDDVEIELGERDRKDLTDAVGGSLGAKFEQRLGNGARAFRSGRYEDARKILAPLADKAPGSVAVRELYGLTLYRLGRWKQAVRELEAFVELSGSTEQHPVLADCHRALRHYPRVEELWAELREASPSGPLVNEGRIVAAGAQADRGDLTEALRTLGHPGWKVPRRPKEHHLRRAYAMADLYERSGDVPRARRLFGRIQAADPGFGDVKARLRSLG